MDALLSGSLGVLFGWILAIATQEAYMQSQRRKAKAFIHDMMDAFVVLHAGPQQRKNK